MKVFHCDVCQQTVFFENVACVSCGHRLAYVPEIGDMAALEPAGEDGVWRSLAPQSAGALVRPCSNDTEHGVCNWTVPADGPHALCPSCRLNRVVPNLEIEGNLEAWRKLEAAKRRLVYSLLELRLPIDYRDDFPETGLTYEFLADPPESEGTPVLTGHANGVITINIAEADDLEREKRRLTLHEPYRTLLGHFRHEVGHYYWDRLIRDGGLLDAFRERFGDEREDYPAALARHYEQGAPEDWQQRFVTSYASSHPWEDWAETWAHYLHMVDSLETAAVCGVAIIPRRPDEPSLPIPPTTTVQERPFDTLVADWVSLTYALNNLNRSLGLPDGYPFVLAPAAVEKLRFVHEVATGVLQGTPPVATGDGEDEPEAAATP